MKPYNSSEWLRNAYERYGTIRAVAQVANCGETTIRRKMTEFGIPYKHDTSKGYRTRSTDGYWLIQPEGEPDYVYEHRWLVEMDLGKRLEDDEYVHHLNHVKDDNRLENLIVVTHKEHMELHAGPAKKTLANVERIVELRNRGYLANEIAPIVDLCAPLVRRVLNQIIEVRCGLCNTEFKSQKALSTHIQRSHR